MSAKWVAVSGARMTEGGLSLRSASRGSLRIVLRGSLKLVSKERRMEKSCRARLFKEHGKEHARQPHFTTSLTWLEMADFGLLNNTGR